MNRYFLIACVSTLVGCGSPGQNSIMTSLQTEVFQLHTAPDGRVYRIETRTGKTSWLDGSIFRPVTEPTMPQLAIGRVYRDEDGTSTYRYEGAGKLEKWGLDRYNTSPQQNISSQR